MLLFISWRQYIVSVIALSVAYYFFVLLRYCRKDIEKLFRDRWGRQAAGSGAPVEAIPAKPEGDDPLFTAVYKLMGELKILFQQAAGKHFQKQELLTALQLQLKTYPQLKSTPFQVAVNNHVTQQAAMQCQIALDEWEIKQIW